MMRKSLPFLVVWAMASAAPAEAQGFDPRIEEASCDMGSALSCQVMGSAYAQGDGVPKDVARAAAYFRRACEGGNMQGCRGLGILFAVGQGVGQDFAQAETLFRQACSGGDSESCRLAEMARSDRELAESQQAGQQPTPQPQPAPAAPASPVAVAGGDGDVFNQCVKMNSLPRSGLQMMWQLQNMCNAPVKVAYCLRAKYEAAGDWNLCSRREHRTASLRPLGTTEFPFTLISEGTGMTDGRVVSGNDKLYVEGFACANGGSPSVHFDNGQFRMQHC